MAKSSNKGNHSSFGDIQKSYGIFSFDYRLFGRRETRIQRAADVIFLFRAGDEDRVVRDPDVAGDYRFFSQHRYRERKALLPIHQLDGAIAGVGT